MSNQHTIPSLHRNEIRSIIFLNTFDVNLTAYIQIYLVPFLQLFCTLRVVYAIYN